MHKPHPQERNCIYYCVLEHRLHQPIEIFPFLYTQPSPVIVILLEDSTGWECCGHNILDPGTVELGNTALFGQH